MIGIHPPTMLSWRHLLAIAYASTTDHVLGRPSSQFRKVQVFAVVSFWSFYLLRYVNLVGHDCTSRLIMSQRRETWPTIYSNPLCSSWEAIHSLAMSCPYSPLALCGSQFCQNHRPRITRTFGESVQPSFLPSNMDNNCAGCGLLERYEDQEQEAERCSLDCFHRLLLDSSRTG